VPRHAPPPMTKPTWKVVEFFRSGATDRVCQAIYPYIFNAGQETEDKLPARKIAMDIFRRRFGNQYLASFAAARAAQRPGGAYDILHWLDKLQVPLDEADAAMQTPLFYAAREANYEAVAFLLQRGARAERLDHNSQNALFYAAKSDPKQEGTRIECERRKQWRAMAGRPGDTRKDIRKDLDANGRPHKENRLAVIDILVEYGADPTHKDELERSALDYARDDEILRRLEALCHRWRAQGDVRPPPMAQQLPLVEPPCMYLSKLDAVYDGQYMVAYSDQQDVEALVQLESEFIDDHARIIELVHGAPAPPATVCKSVGVSPKEAERKRIIKSITGQRNRLDCTMKIMHINAYTQGGAQAACARLITPPKVVGYMYQKVKVDFSRADRKGGIVEVSHLKVSKSYVRRGLATLMFCGLVQHLGAGEGEELRPMQLSVFDRNDAACRLYEKLGFVSYGESWDSELSGWGSAQEPMRHIRWRRYRRFVAGETTERALAALEAKLPPPSKWKWQSSMSSNDPPAKKPRTSSG